MNKALARVTSASLNIKDSCILTFWINVDYEEGMSQDIGGYALDTYDKVNDTRVGTAYGCELIRQLLTVLDVDDFSQMRGKTIWVLTQGEGLATMVTGIQALKADGGKQIIFNDIFNKFKNQ